jgi:hypothetical protein
MKRTNYFKNMRKKSPGILFFVLFVLSLLSCEDKRKTEYSSWEVVGGNPLGNKYSSLSQIDTSNVQQLAVVGISRRRR